MRRTFNLVLLFFTSTLIYGQFAEFLMTVDNTNGNFSRINKIPNVKWIAGGINSTTIDQDNGRFIFYGTTAINAPHQIYTVDIATGKLLYSPHIANPKATNEWFGGFHYIGNNTIAGIYFKNDGSASFIHIDITNGAHKIVGDLGKFVTGCHGSLIYDEAKEYSYFLSYNVASKSIRIFTIESQTGKVLSSPYTSGISTTNIGGLAMDKNTSTLYCLAYESQQHGGKVTLASINPNTGILQPIKELQYSGIVGSPSSITFDQKRGLYICRLSKGLTTQLVSINVKTKSIVHAVNFDAPANPHGSDPLTRPNILGLRYCEKSDRIIALGWREIGNCTPPPAPPTPPTPPTPPVPPVTPPTPSVTLPDSNSFRVSIPNSFTPNGDGVNEIFRPIFSHETTYTMHIYNRWGETLKNCANCGWDGKYEGMLVQPGTYTYVIVIKNIWSDTERMFRGGIHVLW